MIASVPRKMFLSQFAVAILFAASITQTKADTGPVEASPRDLGTANATPQAAAGEIDRLLQEEVLANLSAGQTLASVTSDQAFLRRVYFDFVGEPPTPGETTAFCLDPSPDKRTKLVERLLADKRFGRNWGRYWRDVILYRRSADQALLASQSLETFLIGQFNGQPRWNAIAKSFITAQGNIYDKGETGLFMAHLAEPVEVAAETSRIFLGIQIQCAQCHDHPTDRWKRQQFHEFVAFFPRASMRRQPTQPPTFELTSFDMGPQRRRPGMMTGRGSLEHFMPNLKDPASEGSLMMPVFFATGDKLPTGTTDHERRHALAAWLTSPNNPWFATALVNRLWAELVGEGFYEPIDDLGPDRSASAPRTLDYLCRQFVAHDYDVKWLMGAIASTDAYQRESRPRRHPDQVPFAANVAYRLRADQLFDAVALAVGVSFDTSSRTPARAGLGFRGGPRFAFAQQFGYDPSVRRDEITSTIPQVLSLMNSPLVNQRITGRQPGGALARLLDGPQDDEAVPVELYLRCLCREPNDAELAVCLDHVKSTPDRAEAFGDIFWSLLNSQEFLYRN
ncbi:MAG TPA: DUF1549 domain-containing protein [Pirellulales bacterium]|nr:DUF1549 domain-containing protein [Pirellulales bacterium]